LLVHLKRVAIKGGTILHVCRDVTERKLAEEELRQQLRFEALIGGLSARFASPADGELGSAIGENLRTLGEFLAVDRVTLWEMAAEPPAFSAVDSWSVDGVRPAPPLIPLERVPLIGARLASGVPFGFASTAELPAGAVAEQTFVGTEGLRSWLVIPLTIGGSLLGALSLGMLRHERGWPADLVQRLRLVGQIFGNALARQRGAAARAAARQELAHASRLAVVGELTASIAHEINQPLAAILSNAGAALRLLGPEPERLEEVRHILTDIRADDVRASDVIQRVRALLARREMEAHRLDVNDVASDVLRLVRLDANRRGVILDPRLAPDLPSVRGDRVQIQQALLNFLLNGMEAMAETPPGRRRLVVRTARRHDDVEVAVTDTGHGIPPERVDRLFASFFTTKPEGMGLGLSIARSVVEAHGGRAWAENEPGGGATFRFTLPAPGPGDADGPSVTDQDP
jgi:signal transduction histidine kinase